MLQSIHDKIQGLVSWIIAIILALTFALWGAQNYLRSSNKQVVAKVNNKEISQRKLQLAYDDAKNYEIMKVGSDFLLNKESQLKLKQSILQNLIRQEIISQAQNELGLKVCKQQLMTTIGGLPYFQVNGEFSSERFQQIMLKLRGQESVFFSEITHAILYDQLERGVMGSSFILPNEIAFVEQMSKQRRDFGYFIVTPERFFETISISDEIIKKYYIEHQNEFFLPEKVSIQYLELSFADLPINIKPTEGQLKKFYHDHIDSFKDIKDKKIKPYSKVIAKVRRLYEREQLSHAFAVARERLADLVYTNPDSLEPAAKDLNLRIKNTDLITNAGSKKGILANPKIIQVAFSEQILKQRYNSNLIELSSDRVIVLRIKDHLPKSVQSLDQVQDRISSILRIQEAKKMALSLANEMLQELYNGRSEIDLEKQYELVWNRINGAKFKYNNKEKLVEEVFGLIKPNGQRISVKVIEYKSGYAVFRLDRVYEVSSTNNSAIDDGFINSLPEILGNLEYQILLDSFIGQAKIKIFDKTLEQLAKKP
ncbi:MAG: SurA N-terminal domain-containing protein [Coxiellaceae bacterium]|jgi:peptidyl-prolyl cis-trans isomerase D|nr:SurA N-terminal domain-containing protein [Coxiellaceae bacterium]